jgi:hypothetical protein
VLDDEIQLQRREVQQSLRKEALQNRRKKRQEMRRSSRTESDSAVRVDPRTPAVGGGSQKNTPLVEDKNVLKNDSSSVAHERRRSRRNSRRQSRESRQGIVARTDVGVETTGKDNGSMNPLFNASKTSTLSSSLPRVDDNAQQKDKLDKLMDLDPRTAVGGDHKKVLMNDSPSVAYERRRNRRELRRLSRESRQGDVVRMDVAVETGEDDEFSNRGKFKRV